MRRASDLLVAIALLFTLGSQQSQAEGPQSAIEILVTAVAMERCSTWTTSIPSSLALQKLCGDYADNLRRLARFRCLSTTTEDSWNRSIFDLQSRRDLVPSDKLIADKVLQERAQLVSFSSEAAVRQMESRIRPTKELNIKDDKWRWVGDFPKVKRE